MYTEQDIDGIMQGFDKQDDRRRLRVAAGKAARVRKDSRSRKVGR